MRVLAELRERLRGLTDRGRRERELDEELRFHIDMATEAAVRDGAPRAEARRRAMIAFGGVDRFKEEVREARGLGWVGETLGDVRYAARRLRRSPVFTLIAIATLALGIGGSTAIFSVVDTVLLRPLGFPQADRLVMIWARHPVQADVNARVSAAYLHDWRTESRTFQDMAGWQDATVNLTGNGPPLELLIDRATPNLFSLLGVNAHLGQTFSSAHSPAVADAEAVLSHGFWQRRYGGDPAVLGRSITLDGSSYTIVGVMPEGFTIRTAELPATQAELWVPMALAPGPRTGMPGVLTVVARLAPGVTVEQARSELAAISRIMEEDQPHPTAGWQPNVRSLHEATVADARPALLVLFGAVALLLVIGCVNVANLVLSRTSGRRRELAVRLSLGATRARIARQLLTENVVLAAAGGVLGVLLAIAGVRILLAMLPPGLELPASDVIGVDPRILAFALLATALTAIMFGLAPALGFSGTAPHGSLREGSRGSSTGRGSRRLRSALIASEVALALMLLAGAGLVGVSFWRLSQVDPGFRPTEVLTMRTTLSPIEYPADDQLRAFARELMDRANGEPGVRAAGIANYLPLTNRRMAGPFEIEGRAAPPPGETAGATIVVVGGRFFEAMGIPLLAGRLFDVSDHEGTQPVFIIDEALAGRYWPEGDAVGARIIWQRGQGQVLAGEVIGVVGSVRYSSLTQDPDPAAYFWFPQLPQRQITLVARGMADPLALAAPLTATLAEIDPNQPAAGVRPMQGFVEDQIAQTRFTLLLLGGFALAALTVVAIGIYGVVAYNVSQRTREIGIRSALGATPREIMGLALRQGMMVAGIGVAAGLVGALLTGRIIAGLLYGVPMAHAASLLLVTLFLAVVALLATWLPARQATRVDPVIALRSD